MRRSVDEGTVAVWPGRENIWPRTRSSSGLQRRSSAEERCEAKAPIVTDGSTYPAIYRRLARVGDRRGQRAVRHLNKAGLPACSGASGRAKVA